MITVVDQHEDPLIPQPPTHLHRSQTASREYTTARQGVTAVKQEEPTKCGKPRDNRRRQYKVIFIAPKSFVPLKASVTFKIGANPLPRAWLICGKAGRGWADFIHFHMCHNVQWERSNWLLDSFNLELIAEPYVLDAAQRLWLQMCNESRKRSWLNHGDKDISLHGLFKELTMKFLYKECWPKLRNFRVGQGLLVRAVLYLWIES